MSILRRLSVLVIPLLLCIFPVGAAEVERVSIIQLLANPQTYEGRKVEVSGFVSLEFEGNAIWLHEEDFKRGLYQNALWLNVAEGGCEDVGGKPLSAYASLAGIFTAKAHGHMGLWPAQITLIGSSFPLPARN